MSPKGCLESPEALLSRLLAYYAVYDLVIRLQQVAEIDGRKSEELEDLKITLREVIDSGLMGALHAMGEREDWLTNDLAMLLHEAESLRQYWLKKAARASKASQT